MAEKRTKRSYLNLIKNAMGAIGTYRSEFDQTIDRLATLYVDRDTLQEQFIASGAVPVVYHTNKFGAENLEKSPILTARDQIYTQLLAHEKELGLTPAALKKMNDTAFRVEKKSSFADTLKQVLSE